MKGYPIERDDFCAILHKIKKNEEDFYDAITERGETESFVHWYSNEEETIYILHKESGVVISWYKPLHLGRALEANVDMSLDLWAELLDDFCEEISEPVFHSCEKRRFKHEFTSMTIEVPAV